MGVEQDNEFGRRREEGWAHTEKRGMCREKDRYGREKENVYDENEKENWWVVQEEKISAWGCTPFGFW